MLRGPLGSVALLRGMLNPLLRRTVSTAPIRYADDKGRKKSDGMFSWLKEMLRPDTKPSEALTAVDQPEVTAYDIDFPANVITFSSNFKHEDATDRDTSTAGTSEPRDPTASIFENRTNFCVNLAKLESKIDENEFPSLIRDNFINTSLGQRQRISLLRHDFLTLNSPFRTIVGCTPRNTKPPIREPNMPEKQEKKDDKKDKKQKKPVIRMEGGIEDGKKDLMAEAKSNLHDNMDVNFRCQWGIRIPEEVGTAYAESSQKWNKGVEQARNTPYFVGDTNYQATYAYSMDAMETMKGMKLNMSTVGDKGKTETKTEEKKPVQVAAAAAGKHEKATEESIKNILKTSSTVLKESAVVDEEFTAPNSIDAEISAWKELVQKSKTSPVDATKEFNAQMGSDSPRATEMLTIRPEPPRPKLDVRAVRSVDELIKEDEEEELTGDVKAKPVDVKRNPTTTDVQKLDSKKMHTAALCYLKRNNDSGYECRRKYRIPTPSWAVDAGDRAHDAKYVAADFSTSTEGGYENIQQNVTKGARGVRQSEPEPNRPSQDMERSNVPIESLAPQEIHQPEQMVEQEFVESLHPIADREIEMSLNQAAQDSHQEVRESQMSSKKYEAEERMSAEHMSGQSEDFQGNFEYASPYEDDFYPGYESMSLEPLAERPNLEKQPQQGGLRDEEQDDKEMYSKKAKEAEKISDYVTEGKYVRVPGDPYPYSKEHFNKWRLHHEDIRIGPISYLDKDPLISTPITDSSTGQRVDVQQPVRKMSYDSRSRPAWGTFVRR